MKVEYTPLFLRILEAKTERGLLWDELARKAKIRLSSWMVGSSACQPTDDEVRRIADALGLPFERLKYGQ